MRPRDTLTPREIQAAQNVSQGFNNKEIASNMGVSRDTVKKWLLRIFDKVGCDSRTELAIWYFNTHGAYRDSGIVSGCGAVQHLGRLE